MPAFSSLDKDQIKVVIDEVTRWLDLAEEGDWMTLPGIAGRQYPEPGSVGASQWQVWGLGETYPLCLVDPGCQLSRHVVLGVRSSSDLNSEAGGILICFVRFGFVFTFAYLFLRDSTSRGGAEREGDTESGAASRL